MSDSIDRYTANEVMGQNIIRPEMLNQMIPFKLLITDMNVEIPFSRTELSKKSKDYFLIWGASHFINGSPVTIRNMITLFGKNPDQYEPCFYNQDWYENESFLNLVMRDGWYLIRKNVYEESRAVQPTELILKYDFPTAISCVYSFFAVWFTHQIPLWYHDFVWCKDTDHNGDRIYVGKYNDIDGVNKNGFSIHRHLSLRPCYACID